jgi:hypothetical protein
LRFGSFGYDFQPKICCGSTEAIRRGISSRGFVGPLQPDYNRRNSIALIAIFVQGMDFILAPLSAVMFKGPYSRFDHKFSPLEPFNA